MSLYPHFLISIFFVKLLISIFFVKLLTVTLDFYVAFFFVTVETFDVH